MKFKPHLIQINVTDADRAKHFYCDVLGFEEDQSHEVDGVTLLDSASDVPVLLYAFGIEASPPKTGKECGPVLVLEVEDIQKTVAEWKAKDVTFVPAEWADADTGIAGCPFGLFVGFTDPDGNYFEILQPHPEDLDEEE